MAQTCVDLWLHGLSYDGNGILADVLEPEKLKVTTSSFAVNTLSGRLSDNDVAQGAASLNNKGRVAFT